MASIEYIVHQPARVDPRPSFPGAALEGSRPLEAGAHDENSVAILLFAPTKYLLRAQKLQICAAPLPPTAEVSPLHPKHAAKPQAWQSRKAFLHGGHQTCQLWPTRRNEEISSRMNLSAAPSAATAGSTLLPRPVQHAPTCSVHISQLQLLTLKVPLLQEQLQLRTAWRQTGPSSCGAPHMPNRHRPCGCWCTDSSSSQQALTIAFNASCVLPRRRVKHF